MPLITEMFAFVATEDEPDDEGVIGMTLNMPGTGPTFTPMVGSDMKRIESLRNYAITIGRHSGKKITLKRFKLVSDEEVVYDPNDSGSQSNP